MRKTNKLTSLLIAVAALLAFVPSAALNAAATGMPPATAVSATTNVSAYDITVLVVLSAAVFVFFVWVWRRAARMHSEKKD